MQPPGVSNAGGLLFRHKTIIQARFLQVKGKKKAPGESSALIFCQLHQAVKPIHPGKVRVFGTAHHAAAMAEVGGGHVQGVDGGAGIIMLAAPTVIFSGGGTVKNIGVIIYIRGQAGVALGVKVDTDGRTGGTEEEILSVGFLHN